MSRTDTATLSAAADTGCTDANSYSGSTSASDTCSYAPSASGTTAACTTAACTTATAAAASTTASEQRPGRCNQQCRYGGYGKKFGYSRHGDLPFAINCASDSGQRNWVGVVESRALDR